MKIFYHDDLDGRCAAYWVDCYLMDYGDMWYNKKNPEYFPMDYDKDFSLNEIKEDEWIFIVDYSIDPEVMEKLLNITKEVIWIDHHKSAIEKYKNFNEEIDGIRKDGIAASALSFIYFFNKKILKNIDKIKDYNDLVGEVPEFTLYISDFDTWHFNFKELSSYFITALDKLHDTSPLSDIWQNLENDEEYDGKDNFLLSEMLDIGVSLYNQDIVKYNKEIDKYSFESWFGNNKCLVMNISGNGKIGELARDRGYDLIFCYIFDGEKYNISLYSSDKIDSSKIAIKYGGGGHKGASGFRCNNLTFENKRIIIE